MLKNKVKRVYKLSLLLTIAIIILSLIAFVKILLSANVLLLLVNVLVTLLLVTITTNGWSIFLSKYVYDECNLNEFEQFLLSDRIKPVTTKQMLKKLSLLTGHKNGYQDESLEEYINLEQSVFLGKEEKSISEYCYNKFKESEDLFISTYAPILEKISEKKLEEALDLLDSIGDDNNYEDLQKNFYLAYVLTELGIDNWETRNSINVIKNRGKESRYYQYAEKLW